MTTKQKSFIKRYLMKLWHLAPCSDIYMFHHVSLNPQPECSCCKYDTADFEAFVSVPRRYASLDAVTEDGNYGGLSAITFDDGLEDVYTLAYPILKARKIPFTVFVLSRMLGRPGYLTEAQLLELAADPLVTIGSHGTEHRILTQIPEELRREEIFGSKAELEAILGKPCRFFAYSHGQYDEAVLAMVAEAGYTKAFAVAGRPLNRRTNKGSYAYPRLSVEQDTKIMFD